MTGRPTPRGALRCALVVGLGVVLAVAPSPTVAESPPLTIRAPLIAEPGAVPPAVVASESSLLGTTYDVVSTSGGGTIVNDAVLQPLDHPAPWNHAALADLSAITGPGTYEVRIGSTPSDPIVVTDGEFADVVTSGLEIFDSNADGEEPSSYHEPSHLNDRRSKIANGADKGERVNVLGGWMDAGDQLKFTVTTAYATLMLELTQANQPTAAGEIRDAAAIGRRFLLKAHPRRGVFVAQVGHTNADHKAGFRDPTVDDTSDDLRRRRRPSYVLTGATGGSDVAAITAAALATASLRVGPELRDRLIVAARAWLAKAKRLGEVWENCCYQQASWRDDVAVAQAALWRATGRASYAEDALVSLKRATDNGDTNWVVRADGFEMAGIAAAELCGVLRPGDDAASDDVRRPACRILRQGGSAWIYAVNTETAFGRAGWEQWATVRQSESGAVVLALAERAGLDDSGPALDRATGWFLGVNPWGNRWQSDVGGGIENPYHWVQVFEGDLPGAVVGGPAPLADINANRYYAPGDPLEPGPFDTPDQTYTDLAPDYVMNEVGIGYSAPAVLHFALISPA